MRTSPSVLKAGRTALRNCRISTGYTSSLTQPYDRSSGHGHGRPPGNSTATPSSSVITAGPDGSFAPPGHHTTVEDLDDVPGAGSGPNPVRTRSRSARRGRPSTLHEPG